MFEKYSNKCKSFLFVFLSFSFSSISHAEIISDGTLPPMMEGVAIKSPEIQTPARLEAIVNPLVTPEIECIAPLNLSVAVTGTFTIDRKKMIVEGICYSDTPQNSGVNSRIKVEIVGKIGGATTRMKGDLIGSGLNAKINGNIRVDGIQYKVDLK